MKLFTKSSVLAIAVMGAVALSPTSAKAQTGNLGQLVSGLINVVAGVNVTTGDIILNDVDLVDIETINIENVLNNNEIRVLNNLLNRNQVLSNNSNFLNNLLRNADFLNENQVVVGILNIGGVPFVVIR